MYAGAVVALISGIAGAFTFTNTMHGIFHDKNGAVSPFAGPATVVVGVFAVFGILVTILLWLWMAWKCKAGRPWARIVSTVLFGAATISTLTSLTGGSAWSLAGALVSWLVGLGATILLWQRSSSWYFRSAPRY